jgi:hypothetical protein
MRYPFFIGGKMKKNQESPLAINERKGNPSNDHWQVNVDITPEGNDDWPSASFLPRAGKKRPTPHKKLNECDH